jgi:uncharacterized protein (DUF362 family)
MARVFIDRLGEGASIAKQVRQALEFLRWEELIPSGARIFLKPNLTWRAHLPGVTTTPAFIEACVQVLKDRTPNITIGESDGGYHGFRAEEGFESHRLYDLAKRYGVRIVNLTREKSETARGVVAGQEVSVDLPVLLLRETDVFLTLPVPKIHATTRVSLGFKNQWGCLPSPMRLHHHPQFARKILLINRAVCTRIALFDATYMLDRTGPMVGDPIRTNLIIASDDAGAGSLACCWVMGVDPWTVAHLRMARDEGMTPADLSLVAISQSLDQFCSHQFRLRRNLMNWIAVAGFHSGALTRLIYDSAVADVSHRVLYSIRKNPWVARFLYGKLGPPEIEGSREAPVS